MVRKCLIVFGTLLGLAAVDSARAASIGVNFTGGGNGGSPAVSLLSTDSAGVVPQTNYNNVPGGTGTALPLVDNTGAASPATLTFSAGGTYSSIGGAGITPADGNEKLNTGFVFGNSSITVSNIPYAAYNVYVYELNDAAGRVETTTLGSSTFYGAAATPNDAGHVDQNATTPYVYTQSTSTDVANPTPNGDYVLFSNVTGSSFTVTASAPGNGYVNGIQIVQVVPEPASLGLLGFGSLALLARRRKA